MIIIGYPGIGKSSLAGRYHQYIDLESSNFNNRDGTKPEGWYIYYCRLAEDLSRQGYWVFVSCHKEVQEFLKESNEFVMLCYPDASLVNEWLCKLLHRFEHDRNDKNFKAFETASKNYKTHIKAMDDSTYKHKLVLKDMNYTLDNEIDNYLINLK